jgi:hypothetical protein
MSDLVLLRKAKIDQDRPVLIAQKSHARLARRVSRAPVLAPTPFGGGPPSQTRDLAQRKNASGCPTSYCCAKPKSIKIGLSSLLRRMLEALMSGEHPVRLLLRRVSLLIYSHTQIDRVPESRTGERGGPRREDKNASGCPTSYCCAKPKSIKIGLSSLLRRMLDFSQLGNTRFVYSCGASRS